MPNACIQTSKWNPSIHRKPDGTIWKWNNLVAYRNHTYVLSFPTPFLCFSSKLIFSTTPSFRNAFFILDPSLTRSIWILPCFFMALPCFGFFFPLKIPFFPMPKNLWKLGLLSFFQSILFFPPLVFQKSPSFPMQSIGSHVALHFSSSQSPLFFCASPLLPQLLMQPH